MKRAAVALATSLVTATSVVAAQGDPPCGKSGRPVIALRGEGIEPELRARITEQLRAALAGRNLELCTDQEARIAAVAELDVSGVSKEGVVVTLGIRDEVTDKHVSRDIDLRDIPADGRPLTIAQAADELLRATWAELLVTGAPKPRAPVPPEVTEAVQPAPPPAPRAALPHAPLVEVGGALALEHFGSGHNAIGPDVSVAVFPWANVGAILRGGPRSAGATTAEAGQVDVRSTAGGLAVVVAALGREGRAGIDAGPELFVTYVSYEATPRAGVRGMSDRATAAHVSALVRGWVILAGPLRANLGLALGAPLHGVRAVAGDTTLTGVSGVLLGAHIGVGGAW